MDIDRTGTPKLQAPSRPDHPTAETRLPAAESSVWSGCAFLFALVLFAGIAYDLVRMPLQVADSLEEILDARQSPGVLASFASAFDGSAYLRPLRVAQTKLLFDLAQGHYFAVYKAFHVSLLAAAFLLFVRACRVRTIAGCAAAVFALTVFTGIHTFAGTVREAFPINHFLEVTVLCLAALNLAQAVHRWWIDLLANVALATACLTLESGVLVWVVLVAARLAGWSGVSWRGISVATVVAAAFLWVRLVWFSPETATVGASSGYLLEVLEPAEIRARFAGRMPWFHAYTVIAQAASVLFSEPRRGVFIAVRSWLEGDVPPRQAINLTTSMLTTTLVVWAAVHLARRRRLTFDARLLIVFAAVLAGNAAVSFAYAKDEIITVAGAFYALAAYAAARTLLDTPRRGALGFVVGVAMLVTASGWAVRTLGVHHVLRTQAFNHRNDWATVARFLGARGRWPLEPDAQVLVGRLQSEALEMPVVNPWFMERWADRVFDVD